MSTDPATVPRAQILCVDDEPNILEGLALGKTFTEKAFGKDVKRPQLVRPGRWRDFAGPRSCGRVGRLRG